MLLHPFQEGEEIMLLIETTTKICPACGLCYFNTHYCVGYTDKPWKKRNHKGKRGAYHQMIGLTSDDRPLTDIQMEIMEVMDHRDQDSYCLQSPHNLNYKKVERNGTRMENGRVRARDARCSILHELSR